VCVPDRLFYFSSHSEDVCRILIHKHAVVFYERINLDRVIPIAICGNSTTKFNFMTIGWFPHHFTDQNLISGHHNNGSWAWWTSSNNGHETTIVCIAVSPQKEGSQNLWLVMKLGSIPYEFWGMQSKVVIDALTV